MSRYEADDVYCISGTAVLKNKAGITEQGQLDEYEGDFTAIRLLELTQNPVEGSFDLAHLCKIHQYLFQDIYDWAGEVRTVDIIRGGYLLQTQHRYVTAYRMRVLGLQGSFQRQVPPIQK